MVVIWYPIDCVDIGIEWHDDIDDILVSGAGSQMQRCDSQGVQGQVDWEVGAEDDFHVVLIAFNDGLIQQKLSSLK